MKTKKRLFEHPEELTDSLLFVINKKIALSSISRYAEILHKVHGPFIPHELIAEIQRDLKSFREVYGAESVRYPNAFRMRKAA